MDLDMGLEDRMERIRCDIKLFTGTIELRRDRYQNDSKMERGKKENESVVAARRLGGGHAMGVDLWYIDRSIARTVSHRR